MPASAKAAGASGNPWYAEGLCFTCQPGCGACCTNHGDYAYVYLERDDIARLAAFFQLTTAQFKERYTALDDGDVVLKMDQPSCPFLSDYRCSVYTARPLQCRTFPFWKENLSSRAEWQGLKRFCPGIDNGETHSLKVIRTQLALRRPPTTAPGARQVEE